MDEYLHFQGADIKIPDIALGKVPPNIVYQLQREAEIRERAEQKAKLYFWGGIICSVLCMVGGYLLGKYC